MKPEGISQDRWDRGIYWNPWQLVDGCTKVKASCQNCWSLDLACRYKQEFVEDGQWSGRIRFNHDRLSIPDKEHKPTIYAVWNDLFHPAIRIEYICDAYDVMRDCPQHTFLLLTKRIQRAISFQHSYKIDNIWLGTSISTQEDTDKDIPELLKIPAALRWLSVEPLLGMVKLDRIKTSERTLDALRGKSKYYIDGNTPYYGHSIDWVVVGCESGPKRRPCDIEWVRNVVEQCKAAGVPVFVKQLNIGGKVVKDMSKFPEDLRLREWPMSGAGKRKD